MADTKVSALVPATTLNTSDYLLLVQGGNSLKIDIQTLLSHIPSKMVVLEASESPTSGVISSALLVSKLTVAAPIVAYTLPVGTHGMEKQIVVSSLQNAVRNALSATWATSVVTVTTLSTKTASAATWLAGVVTITSTAHGFITGDTIAVAGFTPTGYNGTFAITVIDANTFTYNVVVNPGTLTVAGTCAKGAAHGFLTNDSIVISGFTPTGYNGTFIITVIDAATFTYALIANPGATSVIGVATKLGSATVTIATGAAGFTKLTFNALQSTACLKNIDGLWYLMSSNSVGIV